MPVYSVTSPTYYDNALGMLVVARLASHRMRQAAAWTVTSLGDLRTSATWFAALGQADAAHGLSIT